MSSIPRAPPQEQVFSVTSDIFKNKMILRLDQKLLEWIIDLVSNFSRAGGLVLDIRAGTLETTNASLQLSEHCRLVEREQDSVCFQYAVPSLV